MFLRWGVFGILAVAALLYAYNSSKRLAETRQPPSQVPVSAPEAQESAAGPSSPPLDETPPHCAQELRVAERALRARREQEPLDRVLRMQDVLFEADAARRQRLEKVARDWYQIEGAEPAPDTLSSRVIADCRRFSPAP